MTSPPPDGASSNALQSCSTLGPLDFQRGTLRLMSGNLKVKLRDGIMRCKVAAYDTDPTLFLLFLLSFCYFTLEVIIVILTENNVCSGSQLVKAREIHNLSTIFVVLLILELNHIKQNLINNPKTHFEPH
jgi:hypothetical protein